MTLRKIRPFFLSLSLIGTSLLSSSLFSPQASAAGSSAKAPLYTSSDPYAMTGIAPDFHDDLTPLMPGYWLDGAALPITLPPEPPACALTSAHPRHAAAKGQLVYADVPLSCAPLYP
ncbi:hypothetical protein [Beijerinckia indica]|uniref:Uncharacterized protein n=1 Tax=Beijerinckia indica subsp. indica (strain ATCC 9039 / DSM 1715 / NCIMB 8712) TaxID=395963 RepID=B2IJ22_BEII9|nr:hypothetical protein [Beijerinckia indica]ACB94785.1 hypothetical protein Bind_1143 [Beijerinckia indica subsp. indica ATCC 9039]